MRRFRPHPAGSLFRGHARIIEPALINKNGRAIWTSRPCKSRDRVKDRPKFALTCSQSLFCLFTIIDVCKEEVPRGYLISRVLHRKTADLEPSVNPISATAAVLNPIDLPRLDRLFARLNYARKVIWMNRTDKGPVLQLLSSLAEILQGLAVEKLHIATRSGRSNEPRNVIDDLPPGEFARAQGFLSPLAIFDIEIGSVPFDDFSRFVPQRAGA